MGEALPPAPDYHTTVTALDLLPELTLLHERAAKHEYRLGHLGDTAYIRTQREHAFLIRRTLEVVAALYHVYEEHDIAHIASDAERVDHHDAV